MLFAERALMFSPSQFLLAPLSRELGGLIFQWRNSPRIRQAMLNDDAIAPEEHAKWLARVLHDDTVRYRVLFLDQVPVGLVNFTGISPQRKCCNWGFYLGEPGLPKGTGTALVYYGLNYAFAELPFVREIIGAALCSNLPSIALHKRLGFIETGVREVTRSGGAEPMVSFTLSRDVWTEVQHSIAKQLFEEAY